MRDVVFDTETTGLNARDGDRVIEIGAVELVNGFPTGRNLHIYVSPEGRPIHPDAQAIHGISDDDVRDAPTFAEHIEAFDDFFGEGRLIAHNAPFDIGFLNAELARLDRPTIDPDRVIDTLAIARSRFPGARNTLDGLCARFGIDTSKRELHGALIDTELLAEVYLELTGGRQGGLELGGPAQGAGGATQGRQVHPPQKQRPKVLPPRLTDVERAAHRAFIEEMGTDTLWHRIWAREEAKASRDG